MSKVAGSSSNLGSRLRLLVGIVVSLGALALIAMVIDWAKVWQALQTADYWWLLPSLLSLAAAMVFKVVKWQMLLNPAGRTSPKNVFYSMNIGYLVSDVLPGRLGEIARVYSESRLDALNPAAVLASVVVDRVLDTMMLALLLALVLPTANLPSWVVQSGLVMGVGSLTLLGVCVALAYPVGRETFLRLLAWSPRFPGKGLVEKWAEPLCIGLQGLRGAGRLLTVLLVTLVIWLLTALMYYFAQFAFHIQVPFWAAILVLCTTNLGMVVPSSPGYVGVFHGAVILALGTFGVDAELAFSYALVTHLIGFLPVGLMGAFALWRCGMTLTEWRKPEAVEAE